MKQMKIIEMDGFLKGKCIPGDLKVNETNAEYLVRKFGELESKIALLEVQLKLSEAAERAWESSMMQACGEDGPKSVADKFAELESKLETALRECRSAGITIDNLEAKCAALAADNEKAMEAMRQAYSAVKLAHEKFSAMAAEQEIVNADNAYLRDQIMFWARECDRITYNHTNKVTDAHQSEAERDLANTYPSSSSFLAEVRAQGVDMARNAMIDFVDGEVGPNKNVPGLIRGAEICVSIADQLRKGGNQ